MGQCSSGAPSIFTTSGVNGTLLMHSFFIHLQKLLVTSQGHCGLNSLPLLCFGKLNKFIRKYHRGVQTEIIAGQVRIPSKCVKVE